MIDLSIIHILKGKIMKISSSVLLISVFASSLSAGPIVNGAILNNNGNPHDSVAKKAVKVGVAREVIDPTDTAAQKVVKAKVVQGDQRKKRQIKRNVR